MPDVLPTINNEPAQGIQALLDTVYLWNQDVANELIEQVNELLEELGDFSDAGCIKPYSELTAPVRQYLPCYNGDNVYVAAADIETLPEQFNPSQWILIATKAPVLQAGAGIDINGNEISVEQQVLSDAAAGATAVQPEDLGTAAYASTSDFATAAQGGKADTAVQPGDLGTAAYAATTDFATAAQGSLANTAVQPADLATVATSGSYTDLSNKPAIDGVTLTSQTTKADIGLAGVYKYKGSVATYADLANIQNPDVGDVYNVEDTGDNYAWTGTEWDRLGGMFVPPVTSVNSKTGAVVLSAEDVSAVSQVSVLPTASESNLGNIVQYIGATTENYTNGYFYKCVASDSGVGSGEIDVTYWYPSQFTPPVTGSVDVDVFSQYLEQNNLAPIRDGRIEIAFYPNTNNISFAYNVDTGWTQINIPWTTVTTQAAEDIFANMGFDFDFSGIPTNTGAATGGRMPSATVYLWEPQPVMNSIGVYKDYSELPKATAENVGTPYLVTPYDSESLSPYSPELFMSVPFIINYVDGEAEVTGYNLTPNTQPTDVMIDWATLESFLDAGEQWFDWTNDTINISLNGENYLDVMYNAGFSASVGVQTDGTVASIQQALANMGITVDLTGYTHFQFVFLRLPTEKEYENRQVPAFVPTSGAEETDYVLKATGNGYTYWAEEASGLPDQTGHSGEFLTTDGTDASWAAVDTLPDQTGNSGKFLTTDGTTPGWAGAVPQYTVMPTASASNVGITCQFVGERPEVPASATINQTSGSGLTDLSVNLATFESKEQPTGDETAVFVVDSITPESLSPTSWEEWDYSLAVNPTTFLAQARSTWSDFDSWADLAYLRIEYDNGAWTFYALTANKSEIDAMGDDPTMWGVTVTSGDIQDAGYAVHDMAYARPAANWQKDNVSVDPAQYGISFNGTPAVNDELTVTYTAGIRGYDNGYFYQNQPTYSDPSATISQTAGSSDTVSFQTTVGNTTMSGNGDAIRALCTAHGFDATGGTVDFTWSVANNYWFVTVNDGGVSRNIAEYQSELEGYGFIITGTPEDGDEITCTYSLGNLSNLSVDVNVFQEQIDETGNYNFTADVTPDTVSPTVGYMTNAVVTIDPQTFLQMEKTVNPSPNNDYNYFVITCIGQDSYEITVYFKNGSSASDTPSNIQDWGITITGGTPEINDWTNCDYVPEETAWKYNNQDVDLNDYGITYSGTPVDGDRLTVVYTASQVAGYDWVQKNVQPAGGSAGIDWKTVVDLPANSGLAWAAFPIYTIPGGLPDGEYEFTWQNKCVGVTQDSAFGVVTYNCRFTIENNAVTKQYYGKFSPVMSGDGNWLPSGTFIPRQQTLYNFVHVANNGDIDLYYGGTPWSTDIAAYWDNMEVPGCFRLSAIKNVNTGEEYIARGRIYPGSDPSYAYNLQGQLYMEALAPSPTIPEYHSTTYVEYSDSMQYFLIQPQHAIATGINPSNSPVQCSELDIAVVDTVNGGRYHANVKNGFDTYTATVLEASGTLANAQIGWDRYGQAHLKYNTPANTSGYVNVSTGVKGATSSAGGWSVSSIAGNFTPAVITEVGGTITPTNLGTILQYTGTTNASYTNGYFYKADGTLVDVPATLTATDINPLGCSVTIDMQALTLALMDYTGWDEATVDRFYNEYTYWQIVYDFDNNNAVQVYWNAWGTMTDSGINACFTITGSGITGEQTVTFNSVYTPAGKVVQGSAWVRIDTQPAGSSLPDQTGQSGKFLTTDGTDASWATISALQNIATHSTSIYITDRNASTVAQVDYAVVLGQVSGAGYPNAISEGSVVVGCGAYSLFANYSIAIGKGAVTRANYAIQLGVGTNSDTNTFKVANNNGNFEMMSADGTIPTDRFTTTPVADGSYVPTLSISSGVATRTWAAPSGGLPSQTGNAGKLLTTDGTDASWDSKANLGLSGVTFRTWGANE